MKKLIAAFALMSGAAFAQNAAEPFGYASIGTAFKITSSSAVAYTTASTVTTFTSSSVPATTYRVMCTTDCHINFNGGQVVTPSATTSMTLVPAYMPEYFVMGAKTNLAVIGNAASGVIYIGKTGK